MAGKSKKGGFHPERFVWALIIGIIAIAAIFYFFNLDINDVMQNVDESIGTIGDKAGEILGETSPSPTIDSNEEHETIDPDAATQPKPITTSRPLDGEKDFSRVMPREGALSVIVLDVGQGNAIFVQMPNGRTMLIDTGEYEYWKRLDGYLKSFGVARLDAVIGSHPHSDHIGSLQSVIKNYEVGNLYMPKVDYDSNTYQNLLRAIRSKGMRATATKGGPNQTIALDDGVEIRVLAPNSDAYDDLNDYSIVVRLSYAGHSMLIPADATRRSEAEMLGAFDERVLKSDVLLVSHHGSNTSSSAAFLKVVDPEAAIISLGANNDYGHPHTEVVSRLQKRQIPIYRTDELGCIAVFFTDKGYEIVPETPY